MTLIELMGDAERIAMLNRVCELHDEAIVDEKLAALYVGKSVQTLRRWRAKKVGPEHWKAPAHLAQDGNRTEGANHSVQYRMKHLRDFMNAHFVGSTSEGLNRNETTIQSKIYASFSSLSELREEQPWFQYVSQEGKPVLICHAFAVAEQEFAVLWHHENVDLAWIPFDEAMHQPWCDSDRRRPFHQAYLQALQGLVDETTRCQNIAEQFESFNPKGMRSFNEHIEHFARFDEMSRTL